MVLQSVAISIGAPVQDKAILPLPNPVLNGEPRHREPRSGVAEPQGFRWRNQWNAAEAIQNWRGAALPVSGKSGVPGCCNSLDHLRGCQRSFGVLEASPLRHPLAALDGTYNIAKN
jgi:hypothetical protein